MRHGGESLRIINDRGAAPQADHGRERWTDARNAALAFKRLHQRRFFANFVCTRSAVPINVQIVSAAENILAKKSLGVGVFDRLLHDDRQIAILAAYVDISGMRTDRDGGNHDAFDDRVRIVFENQAVLAGSGLALVAVAEHIFRFGRLLRHKRPLHPRAEPGATSSAQARVLHLGNDRVRAHAQSLLHGLIAVQLEIAIDLRSALTKALRDHAYLVGMGNERSHKTIRDW